MGFPSSEVCVIGATVAGLVCAIDLARRGVRVQVLDPNPDAVSASIGHGVATILQGELLRELAMGIGVEAAHDHIRAARNAIAWVQQVANAHEAPITHSTVSERCLDGHIAFELRHEAQLLRGAGVGIEFTDTQPLAGGLTLRPGFELRDQVVLDPRSYAEALHAEARDRGVEVTNDVTVVRLTHSGGQHVVYHRRSSLALPAELLAHRSGAVVDTLGVTPWGRHARAGRDAQLAPVVTARMPQTLDRVVALRDSPAKLLRPAGESVLVIGHPMTPAEAGGADERLADWVRGALGGAIIESSVMWFDPFSPGQLTSGASPIAGGFWAVGNGFWELTSGTASGQRLARLLLGDEDAGLTWRDRLSPLVRARAATSAFIRRRTGTLADPVTNVRSVLRRRNLSLD